MFKDWVGCTLQPATAVSLCGFLTMALPQTNDPCVLDTNRHLENTTESRNDESDDDSDDGEENDESINRVVTFGKDCCVRTVLVSVVVTTAIVMVVIVVSYRKTHEKSAKTTEAQKVSVR